MSKRPIEKEDLLKIKFVGAPQISPDGASAIYPVKFIDEEKNKYFAHLWHMDMGTKESRRFTNGEVADTHPLWSPDGKHIAFLRTKEKKTQIWSMPSDGGEPQQNTDLPEGAITSFEWSPDSKRLVFTFRPKHPDWTKEAIEERKTNGKSNPVRIIDRLPFRAEGFGFIDERQHLWICEIESGKITQLTDGEYDEAGPTWAPDGESIAFVSNRSEEPSETPWKVDIWSISPSGGEAKKIDTPTGFKSGIAFSPDSSTIAYVGVETEEDGWYPYLNRVWTVSSNGGDAKCLTAELDSMVGNMTLSDTREAFHGAETPKWSKDGSRIYFGVSHHGSTHLYRIEAVGGEAEALTEGALDVIGMHGDPSAGACLLQIAYPTRPAELYSASMNGGTLEIDQVTDHNGDLIDELQLGDPEEIWVESTEGTKVHGWVMKPPHFNESEKYPLLLYIHGGPHAQYGNSFFHELQWHAAKGYAVLYTNPRGSHGYSQEHVMAIAGDWGKRDFEDIMACVDAVSARGYIDETRMASAGGSYGGYMTNWIIGHDDRFKCAITDRSVYNFQSMFATSDIVFTPDGYWEGNPWDNPDKLRQQSPMASFGSVKTPTLIIHSEGDLRCPIEQAEQLFVTLKRIKQDVVFCRYPAETNHGLSRGGPPDLRMDRLQRIGDWLDKYLK